jgi:hypothetical protein
LRGTPSAVGNGLALDDFEHGRGLWAFAILADARSNLSFLPLLSRWRLGA